jgi:magnesium transporter
MPCDGGALLCVSCRKGSCSAQFFAVWQRLELFDYGPHRKLIALTVMLTLVGIVTLGSIVGSILPFVLKRLGFDPVTASASFVATLVDVSGIVIYFTAANLVLRGTLL